MAIGFYLLDNTLVERELPYSVRPEFTRPASVDIQTRSRNSSNHSGIGGEGGGDDWGRAC